MNTAVLLLLACGAGSVPASTADAALAALGDGDVERAVALAEGIAAVETRDLVLAEVARESGRDVCDRITDLPMRDGCRSTLDRHHLRLPEARAGGGGQRRTTGPVPADCADQPDALRDTCLLREAEAVPVDLAGSYCAAIGAADRAAECTVRLSERTVADGKPDQARALCAGLEAGTWREDCFFRLSETLPGLSPVEQVTLCAEAGRFETFCVFHVASSAGMSTAAQQQGVSFETAIAALAATSAQLGAGIDHPVVSDEAVAREVWITGLGHLFMSADAAADIGLWTARVDALDDPAVRALAQPVLSMSWARAQLDQDRRLAQWATLQGQALAQSATGAMRTPLDLSTPSPGSEHPPGQAPAVLLDDACDHLDPQLRQLIAVLWGLGPQDWATGRAAVTDALAHPSAAVRHAQVQLLEERIWSWRNEQPPPAWLAAALDNAASAEPLPDLATAMSTLQQAIERGARPGGQPFPGPVICGPRPGGATAPEQR